jgi:predicted lipid-binding transport protein (Tim44 family)
MHPLVLRLVERSDAKSPSADKRGRELAQLVGAMVGLMGGLAAGLSGLLLAVASWFTGNEGARQRLSTAGSVLLCLTIPFLILGALCMDWLEKKRTQYRLKIVRYNEENDDER